MKQRSLENALLLQVTSKRSKTVVSIYHRWKWMELETINLILLNPPVQTSWNDQFSMNKHSLPDNEAIENKKQNT